MADETRSDDEGPRPDEDAATNEGAKGEKSNENEPLSSREALERGLGLLWRAAKSAADEIKREVDSAGVKDSLKQAGRDLEHAAQEASKALEEFFERGGPRPPKPDYTDKWPPEERPAPKRADAGIPEDGGTDEEGRRRDMRILVDDDD